MSSASKVGEIFAAAGTAFSKLGELTMQLHPSSEPAPSSGKWTDNEIEMLQTSVKKFGEDLNGISEIIKSRTVSQIKSTMKRKSYEEAGLSPPAEEKVSKKSGIPAQRLQQSLVGIAHASGARPQAKKTKTTSDVTLSALNMPEADVDIEGLGEQQSVKKLEFDSDLDSSIL